MAKQLVLAEERRRVAGADDRLRRTDAAGDKASINRATETRENI